MRFDILTIFPKIFNSYFNESIIKRAIGKKLVDLKIHDIRTYTQDKHRTTDDRPYGGGPGMVMKVEPIYYALKNLGVLPLKKKNGAKIILLTPRGRTLNQNIVKRLSKNKRLVLICGHYEGFDERIKNYVDEELSIGNYVLTSGELAAMIIVDSTCRLIPGVLGHADSAQDESFAKNLNIAEYPHYTRPANFRGKAVPKLLLQGNHLKIKNWRNQNRRRKKK